MWLMRWKMRSRRMPALLITPSIRPKFSTPALTMRSAPAGSATLSPLGTALPPAAAISSQTFCAGVVEPPPSPSTAPPRSLTTTWVPSAAASSAISRPMPPPAPVTSTTLSFSMFAIAVSSPLDPAQDVAQVVGWRKAMSLEQSVSHHYTHGSLEPALLDALKRGAKDLDKLSYADLALVDEFHIGGRPATKAVGEKNDLPAGARVLDIGCGIGGPARFFAADRGWKVEGIDLTAEYVEVAKALSRRVGMADAVSFAQASATALPFADASFDGAYMLHVGMNIVDKKSVF